MITEQIENDIRELKEKRFVEDKKKQYNKIATGINSFLVDTKTKSFSRGLIMSFFDTGFFPLSTQKRHIKNIVDTLKENGTISDGQTTKTTKQKRVYALKSNDGESYTALMTANGFKKVDYFKFVVDRNGIPRRRKIATNNLNGQPRNENGEILDGGEWDLSVLRQTKSRDKQGVYILNEKSIAFEKRSYTAKCFIVN